MFMNNQDLRELRDFMWMETEILDESEYEDNLLIFKGDLMNEDVMFTVIQKLYKMDALFNPHVMKMFAMHEDYKELSVTSLARKYYVDDHKDFADWVWAEYKWNEKSAVSKIKDFLGL